MPIYEYQCGACGVATEKLQKISDPPLQDCPECGQAELRKLVSAAGFRLKGGGWYETDFKSGQKKNLVEGENKTAAKSESSTSTDAASTSSKPASSSGSTASSSSGSESKAAAKTTD